MKLAYQGTNQIISDPVFFAPYIPLNDWTPKKRSIWEWICRKWKDWMGL